MQQKVSLKWQYLLSYLSIALIAGAVIGLALYVNSMERLNQSINEAVAVELSTAASYLEEQTKVFQDIGGLRFTFVRVSEPKPGCGRNGAVCAG